MGALTREGVEAYGVDVSEPNEVTSRNLELLDQPVRAEVARGSEASGVFHRRVPAVVAGKRRTLEVFEAGSKRGAAGIALDYFPSLPSEVCGHGISAGRGVPLKLWLY